MIEFAAFVIFFFWAIIQVAPVIGIVLLVLALLDD